MGSKRRHLNGRISDMLVCQEQGRKSKGDVELQEDRNPRDRERVKDADKADGSLR
jgi:hypothetical protein